MVPQIEDSVIVKWIKTEPYSLSEKIDRVRMSGWDSQDIYVEEVYDIQQKIHMRTYYSKANGINILYQSDYFYYNPDNKLTHMVSITDNGEFVIKDVEGDEIMDMNAACTEMMDRRKKNNNSNRKK